MNENLWQQVEAALDERRDPFAEPALAHALAADPATERAARRLVASLASFSGLPAQRRLRPAVTVLAAAVALATTLALFARAVRPSAPGTPAENCTARVTVRLEHTDPPPARGEVVTTEPRRVVRWTLEGTAP